MKALQAESERIIEALITRESNLATAVIEILLNQIELIEAIKDPEDPG